MKTLKNITSISNNNIRFITKSFRSISLKHNYNQNTFVTPKGSENIPKRFYHERVLDHYERPRNVGSFDKNDENVGTGLVGAPACGDVMKLQIKVDKSDRIEDACFKTFGCGSAIASSSYATEKIQGMTLKAAAEIKNSEIANHLSLPPVKLHCSALVEDAIKAAIKDLRNKRVEKLNHND